MPLFRFCQFELPFALGPPDGRYLVRAPGAAAEEPPTHVLLFTTLGAPRRPRVGRRGPREAMPAPDPAPVTTGRATVIDVGSPLADAGAASHWLAGVGEPSLLDGLAVLNRALQAYRLINADPWVRTVGRGQALVARVGYGAGEEVADGRWTDARVLPFLAPRRGRRRALLEPQAALAAVLGGRADVLACEELALRARLDLDEGRSREAALQLGLALDAALSELVSERAAPALTSRVNELRELRPVVEDAAVAALAGGLSSAQLEAVAHVLGRLEAALRVQVLGRQ